MSKIQKTVEDLDLEPVIETLFDRRKSGTSLRSLRDYYNDQVIEATLANAGASVLTDPETVREAIRGEMESAGKQIEIKHKLTELEVDVEQLESRLVSHETLRKFLNDENIVPETETNTVTVDEVRDTVDWATSREEAIIKRKLEQLAQTDSIEFQDIDIDTAITVTCADTGVAYPLDEFIERGGC